MITNKTAIKEEAYIRINLTKWRATGEIQTIGTPIVAPTITTETARGKFEITYTAELFGIMKQLGNKKIEVLAYLLDNKNGQNYLNTSLRKIADSTGTSLKTAQGTVKILRDAGLLRVEGSVYMLSPHLMIKGNQAREAYLMRKFVEMPSETENQGGEE